MDQAPNLTQTLASALTPSYLWTGFTAIIAVFIIISAVLVYHWKNYSFNITTIRKVMYLYFSICGALILAMAVSLISYSS